MAGSDPGSRSARAWALAREQHGLIGRRELLALGFSKSAIEHRLKVGRLHPVRRGIYVVGWSPDTPQRRWMAAILACGEEVALSHRSAAALWGIGSEGPGLIDVSVFCRRERRLAGIRLRIRHALSSEDVVRRNGIPVTSPSRTLLDLTTELGTNALERAVNEADKHDLIDPESLRRTLGRYAGQPGVKRLRALLDRHTFRSSDSELEVLFRPIAKRAGLPPPLTKQAVNGFEVDFYWPDLGLIVETDGLRYHRTPAAQARDRLRDQTHTAGGYTPLRFSYYQVRYEPSRVQRVLAATADRLARSPRSQGA